MLKVYIKGIAEDVYMKRKEVLIELDVASVWSNLKEHVSGKDAEVNPDSVTVTLENGGQFTLDTSDGFKAFDRKDTA